MIVRQALRRVASFRGVSTSAIRLGGGGGNTPNLPPFARLQPPTGKVRYQNCDEIELTITSAVAKRGPNLLF